MKVIDQRAWSWILYQQDDDYFLSVICGSSAMYSRDFILNIDETKQYLQDGAGYIIQLAKHVTSDPSQYKTRHIIAFHENSEVNK